MLSVWQEQSLFEKCKSFFPSPREQFERKNLALERMCQDPLTEAIIYIAQYAHIIKTLLSEIYTSAWKLSVSTRNEMLKKWKKVIPTVQALLLHYYIFTEENC